MGARVKTLVEPVSSWSTETWPYASIVSVGYNLPIIHPPIVVPAPEPGEYPKDNTQKRLGYYRDLIKNYGRKQGGQFVKNDVRARLKHKWFLFKIQHGIIENDRTWLFKR